MGDLLGDNRPSRLDIGEADFSLNPDMFAVEQVRFTRQQFLQLALAAAGGGALAACTPKALVDLTATPVGITNEAQPTVVFTATAVNTKPPPAETPRPPDATATLIPGGGEPYPTSIDRAQDISSSFRTFEEAKEDVIEKIGNDANREALSADIDVIEARMVRALGDEGNIGDYDVVTSAGTTWNIMLQERGPERRFMIPTIITSRNNAGVPQHQIIASLSFLNLPEGEEPGLKPLTSPSSIPNMEQRLMRTQSGWHVIVGVDQGRDVAWYNAGGRVDVWQDMQTGGVLFTSTPTKEPTATLQATPTAPATATAEAETGPLILETMSPQEIALIKSIALLQTEGTGIPEGYESYIKTDHLVTQEYAQAYARRLGLPAETSYVGDSNTNRPWALVWPVGVETKTYNGFEFTHVWFLGFGPKGPVLFQSDTQNISGSVSQFSCNTVDFSNPAEVHEAMATGPAQLYPLDCSGPDFLESVSGGGFKGKPVLAELRPVTSDFIDSAQVEYYIYMLGAGSRPVSPPDPALGGAVFNGLLLP